MTDRQFQVLRHHKLSHIPVLKVDPLVFELRFTRGCSMQNCNAACCKGGVMVDIEERDTILRHADIVRRHMEPGQVQDPQSWFQADEELDMDFPSGRAVGTRTTEHGCVFLKRDGRCVLQTAAEEEGVARNALKPFYCFAFPVTIESGVLTTDDLDFIDRPECCTMIQGGSKALYEICSEELEFVLGSEGMAELTSIFHRKATQ
jgi:Fe-S-cluster containining protein